MKKIKEQFELYKAIEKIETVFDEYGIWFDHLEGWRCEGWRSNPYDHPIQYRALSNVRNGDDDPFEGEGWTPLEAIEDLTKSLYLWFKPNK